MPARKPPAWEAHEGVYRSLRKRGVDSWNQGAGKPALEPGVRSFLADVLRQPWAPRPGRALELGCGTAPILRWLAGRGWRGAGVEVSPSALAIARRLSAGRPLRYFRGSVTDLSRFRDASFDLAVDGQCLHCLVRDADRDAFFREAARVLRPGGCLVVLTMATPILRGPFAKLHTPLFKGVTWHPVPEAETYAGAKEIWGKWMIPIRRFERWERVVKRFQRQGLEMRLQRISACRDDDPLTYLALAGVRT